MKRKYLLPLAILITIALITIPLMACLGAPAKPAAKPAAPDLSTRMTDVESNKVSKTEVYLKTESYNREEIDAKIAAVAAPESDAYPKTETYTRAEIDKLIEKAIADYKATDTNGSNDSDDDNGSVTGEYGDIVDSDGDLELWVERTSPASDPFRLSSGLDEIEFDVVIVNTDKYDTHRFNLSMRISPEDNVALKGAHIDTYPDVGTWTVTRSSTMNDTTMPTPDDDPLYADNDSEMWIDKGDKDSFSIVFVVDSWASEYWDWKLWIEETH